MFRREGSRLVLPEFHKLLFKSKELSSYIQIKQSYLEQYVRFHQLVKNSDFRRNKESIEQGDKKMHEEDRKKRSEE